MHLNILSDQEVLRYNRQISLNQFDFEGQEALKQSKVLIVGLGGLGCSAAQYLTASGVGTLTLVDDDSVELSNLHRQVLHTDEDIGKLKVISAKQTLQQLNPHAHFAVIKRRLNDEELLALIKEHALVLDASDNLNTRNQLNRLCFNLKKTLISGAAIRMEGQVLVFDYTDSDTPCYQCFSSLFSSQELTCVESGVMPPLVGIVGATQAMQAIKVLTNFGSTKKGVILMLDAMTMAWREMKLTKRPSCSVCGSVDEG